MEKSYVTAKNLCKFLFGSAFGVLMFLVPIPQGESFTTLLDFLKSWIKGLFGASLPYIIMAILVVSAGMAFALCVVDLLSDLIGLGMGAKEAGKGLAVIAYLIAVILPVTYLIARLQGLYWYDSLSTGMIIVRDVFVACAGLVVAMTFVKDFCLRKKQD